MSEVSNSNFGIGNSYRDTFLRDSSVYQNWGQSASIKPMVFKCGDQDAAEVHLQALQHFNKSVPEVPSRTMPSRQVAFRRRVYVFKLFYSFEGFRQKSCCPYSPLPPVSETAYVTFLCSKSTNDLCRILTSVSPEVQRDL